MFSITIIAVVISVVCGTIFYSMSARFGLIVPCIIFLVMNWAIYYLLTLDQSGASGWYFFLVQLPVGIISFIGLLIGSPSYYSKMESKTNKTDSNT